MTLNKKKGGILGERRSERKDSGRVPEASVHQRVKTRTDAHQNRRLWAICEAWVHGMTDSCTHASSLHCWHYSPHSIHHAAKAEGRTFLSRSVFYNSLITWHKRHYNSHEKQLSILLKLRIEVDATEKLVKIRSHCKGFSSMILTTFRKSFQKSNSPTPARITQHSES